MTVRFDPSLSLSLSLSLSYLLTLLDALGLQLRKCCNHPYLFEGAEDRNSDDDRLALIRNSGKLSLLHKLLVRLKETGHRVLIFSQMVRMLDILSDYLKSQNFLFQRLDGSMTREQRQRVRGSRCLS